MWIIDLSCLSKMGFVAWCLNLPEYCKEVIINQPEEMKLFALLVLYTVELRDVVVSGTLVYHGR